jgi:hypothetical protein
MKKSEKYCQKCGVKLEEYFLDWFNKDTGERMKGYYCPNVKCQEGCGHIGHDFGWFRNNCKKCGFPGVDSYGFL